MVKLELERWEIFDVSSIPSKNDFPEKKVIGKKNDLRNEFCFVMNLLHNIKKVEKPHEV